VGDGALFWNRGMHLAQAQAMKSAPDYLLWLNDDTELLPDAIVRLLQTQHTLTATATQPVVLVGATADRETGQQTYGGYVAARRWRPFSYQRVWHESEPVECHVMNGNVVLIPHEIALTIGDKKRCHASITTLHVLCRRDIRASSCWSMTAAPMARRRPCGRSFRG